MVQRLTVMHPLLSPLLVRPQTFDIRRHMSLRAPATQTSGFHLTGGAASASSGAVVRKAPPAAAPDSAPSSDEEEEEEGDVVGDDDDHPPGVVPAPVKH